MPKRKYGVSEVSLKERTENWFGKFSSDLTGADLKKVTNEVPSKDFKIDFSYHQATIEEFVKNGDLEYILCKSLGNDKEHSMYFAVYVSEKKTFRSFIPSRGNAFCKRKKCAYGNCGCHKKGAFPLNIDVMKEEIFNRMANGGNIGNCFPLPGKPIGINRSDSAKKKMKFNLCKVFNIPNDVILYQIVPLLRPVELLKLSHVSSHFFSLLRGEDLWQSFGLRHFCLDQTLIKEATSETTRAVYPCLKKLFCKVDRLIMDYETFFTKWMNVAEVRFPFLFEKILSWFILEEIMENLKETAPKKVYDDFRGFTMRYNTFIANYTNGSQTVIDGKFYHSRVDSVQNYVEGWREYFIDTTNDSYYDSEDPVHLPDQWSTSSGPFHREDFFFSIATLFQGMAIPWGGNEYPDYGNKLRCFLVNDSCFKGSVLYLEDAPVVFVEDETGVNGNYSYNHYNSFYRNFNEYLQDKWEYLAKSPRALEEKSGMEEKEKDLLDPRRIIKSRTGKELNFKKFTSRSWRSTNANTDNNEVMGFEFEVVKNEQNEINYDVNEILGEMNIQFPKIDGCEIPPKYRVLLCEKRDSLENVLKDHFVDLKSVSRVFVSCKGPPHFYMGDEVLAYSLKRKKIITGIQCSTQIDAVNDPEMVYFFSVNGQGYWKRSGVSKHLPMATWRLFKGSILIVKTV